MRFVEGVALILCIFLLGCITQPLSPTPSPTPTPEGESPANVTLEITLPHSMENVTLSGFETRGNHEISQWAFANDSEKAVSYSFYWTGGMGGGITKRQLNYTSPAMAYNHDDYLYYCGWYWNAERQTFNCTAGNCGLPIVMNYTIERQKGEEGEQALINNQTICYINGTYSFISIVKPYPEQEIPVNERREPIEISGAGCPCPSDYTDICQGCAPG